MALLTLFSAPKPFTDPHIACIQGNALRNWAALGEQVRVILLGEEPGLAEAAREYGALHIPDVARSPSGAPIVSDMFSQARAHSDTPLLCCVNADILLTPDLLAAGERLLGSHPRFLAVGQRWDLDVTRRLEFAEGWEERLRERARREGSLHKATGSDYFLFPRDCFRDMPRFAIGRAGWDNWMIYSGRRQRFPVVDASLAVFIAHQNHDYAHLPGGQPHYRHPETEENIRLAGGRRAIFQLPDADYLLTPQGLARKPLTRERLRREAEIWPLVALGSHPLAQVSYFLFNPLKAWRESRRKTQKS